MTLPSAGNPISLQQVNVELGLTATASINMGGSAVRGLFGVSSGEIDMSDGYGKANVATVDLLIVAGGGGGGFRHAGGGGAGGLLTGTGITLDTGISYTVTVGSGGAAGVQSYVGSSGANSTFGNR